MTVDKLRTSSPRLKIFDSVRAASDPHVQENLLNMAWQDGIRVKWSPTVLKVSYP